MSKIMKEPEEDQVQSYDFAGFLSKREEDEESPKEEEGEEEELPEASEPDEYDLMREQILEEAKEQARQILQEAGRRRCFGMRHMKKGKSRGSRKASGRHMKSTGRF